MEVAECCDFYYCSESLGKTVLLRLMPADYELAANYMQYYFANLDCLIAADGSWRFDEILIGNSYVYDARR